MKTDPLAREVLATWKRHQQILLFLLQRIPEKHLGAVPLDSKGRDVARQFAHLNRTRLGWLSFHATGERPKKKELRSLLQASGRQIEELLGKAMRKEARVRMFGKSPVRWMGYLIAHESHHRGQILLALKQSGVKLDEKVTVQGLWGKWMFG